MDQSEKPVDVILLRELADVKDNKTPLGWAITEPIRADADFSDLLVQPILAGNPYALGPLAELQIAEDDLLKSIGSVVGEDLKFSVDAEEFADAIRFVGLAIRPSSSCNKVRITLRKHELSIRAFDQTVFCEQTVGFYSPAEGVRVGEDFDAVFFHDDLVKAAIASSRLIKFAVADGTLNMATIDFARPISVLKKTSTIDLSSERAAIGSIAKISSIDPLPLADALDFICGMLQQSEALDDGKSVVMRSGVILRGVQNAQAIVHDAAVADFDFVIHKEAADRLKMALRHFHEDTKVVETKYCVFFISSNRVFGTEKLPGKHADQFVLGRPADVIILPRRPFADLLNRIAATGCIHVQLQFRTKGLDDIYRVRNLGGKGIVSGGDGCKVVEGDGNFDLAVSLAEMRAWMQFPDVAPNVTLCVHRAARLLAIRHRSADAVWMRILKFEFPLETGLAI